MMKCPSCRHTNLAGADTCEKCGQELTSVNIYLPKSELEATLIQEPVTKLKPRPALVATPETSIYNVAHTITMNKSSVLVVEAQKLLGIVTERDILYKAMSEGMDMDKTPIKQIMTQDPETICSDDSIACALHIMSVGGFRNVPVLEGEKPVYVVTIWDILRYIAESTD